MRNVCGCTPARSAATEMMYSARSSFGTSHLLSGHRQIRTRIVGERGGECLHRRLLFLVQLRGDGDVERDVEIARPAVGTDDAPTLDLLGRAGLGAGLD